MGSLAKADAPEIIVKSRYPDIELPSSTMTIPDMLWPQMEKYPEAIALICGLTNEEYTYKQVQHYSQNFSQSLKTLNIEKNSFIGIVSPMCPSAVIAFLGVWRADYTMAPLNHLLTKGELSRKFDFLSIKTVITTKDLLETVLSRRKFKNVIIIGEQEDNPSRGIYSFEKMSATSGQYIIEPIISDNKEKIAVILNSTGTTGDPKSVQISHYALCANTRQHFAPDISNTKMFEEGGKQDVMISCLPVAHLMGPAVCLYAIYQGITVVCLPKFEPKIYHSCFRKYKPTFCPAVTPLVKFLIESPLFEVKDFESLNTVFAGATPLPKHYIDELIKKANRHIVFQELLGMTEMCLLTLCNPSLKNSKIGSVGRLLPNTMAKVVDLKTGETLGPNQLGELRAISPAVMMGYYKDELATAAAFDRDGYYCTGDVGYYDEDECFYLVDRVRDMIKVKGFQVAPKEIETEILKHPKVESVCVIGIPHEKFGEAPRAYIVLKDLDVLPEEIHSFLKDKLASFKHLAGGIEFIDAIPQVGLGKPLRRELRSRFFCHCHQQRA